MSLFIFKNNWNWLIDHTTSFTQFHLISSIQTRALLYIPKDIIAGVSRKVFQPMKMAADRKTWGGEVFISYFFIKQ